jgi:hypothetical protein
MDSDKQGNKITEGRMIDCTNKNPCESKSPDGKCQAKILGYCPHQNISPDDAAKISAGEQPERDGWHGQTTTVKEAWSGVEGTYCRNLQGRLRRPVFGRWLLACGGRRGERLSHGGSERGHGRGHWYEKQFEIVEGSWQADKTIWREEKMSVQWTPQTEKIPVADYRDYSKWREYVFFHPSRFVKRFSELHKIALPVLDVLQAMLNDTFKQVRSKRKEVKNGR